MADVGMSPIRRIAVAGAAGVVAATGRWQIAHALGASADQLLRHGLLVALATLLLLAVADYRRATAIAVPAIVLALAGDLVEFRIGGTHGSGVLGGSVALVALLALAAFLAMAIPLNASNVALHWKKFAVLGLTTMALPLLPGVGASVANQHAFLVLPGIGPVMPGEIGRPLVLLGFAGLLLQACEEAPRRNVALRDLTVVARPAFGILAGAVLLQIAQRDLGPVALLLCGGAIAMSLVTGRVKPLVVTLTAVAIVGLIVSAVIPYIGGRVDAVVDPLPGATSGIVGQAGMARMALAWGGNFGVGLGSGLLTGPRGLPAADTDLALVAFALECGLVGLIAVLLTLAVFLASLWRRVMRSSTGAAQVLGGTLAGLLSVQVVWVTGAATGFLPLSGLTVPFIATGGSSALAISVVLAAICALTAEPERRTDYVTARTLTAPTRVARRFGAGVILVLGVLAVATGVRIDGERLSLDRRVDNPLRQAKALDRGVITLAEGMIVQRTVARNSLNTVARVSSSSAAVAAVLGDPTTDLMPTGATGLAGTMRTVLRCGGSGQGAPRGRWWQDGAEVVRGDPARCRPAGLSLTLEGPLTDAADRAIAGRAGSIAVLDARTGDILALAGREPGLSLPAPDLALRAALPPGSAFKIVVAAAAAAHNMVSARWASVHTAADGSRISGSACGGSLETLMAVSCNQAFAGFAERLGPQVLNAQAHRLGILDSDPSVDGLLGARATLFAGAHPTPGMTAEAGIGQGRVTATSLQMAGALAAIVNGGVWHRPRLVGALCGFDGTGTPRSAPSQVQRAMSPETARTVQAALRGPLEPIGTASSLGSLAGLAGAKTGTAEVGIRSDLRSAAGTAAWIVAFTRPSNGPPLAVAINLLPTETHQSLHGGSDAGEVLARLYPALIAHRPSDGNPACR